MQAKEMRVLYDITKCPLTLFLNLHITCKCLQYRSNFTSQSKHKQIR